VNILMFAHRLEVGGTQTNAIELADALQRLHGMTVTLFATSGPLVALARSKGLRYVAAPDASVHPSIARVRALRESVRFEAPDLVHAWDWWQCLDACCALRMGTAVPLVVSDMMMELTRVLPKRLPTTFGTPEIVRKARTMGRTRAELLLPPVDVALNAPRSVDGAAFRRMHGLGDGTPLIVTVSRLSTWMKSDSLVRAIGAMERLGHHAGLRLVIVGEGLARPALERLAHQVNGRLGFPAVLFTGALLDPRPAYEAADIVIGMGGSALRAMAFRKPVIVVGEGGFSAIFEPSTADAFHDRGFFGRCDPAQGNDALVAQLEQLLADAERRKQIGHFSRQFVVQHHALEPVSARLAGLYRDAVEKPLTASSAALDALRPAAVDLRERRFRTRSRDRTPVDAVTDPSRPPVVAGAFDRKGGT
jgi:glycosyltransferase involved in cell wall biosynthesis